ncbi:MAG: trehalose 6-phosphate phosphatase [Alphaproteobacteria bacterium]|nr:trehalose 6-phosphate phosphatase [Alphaproteobacteria bacterium]
MSEGIIFPHDLHRVAFLLDVDGTILDLAPTPRAVWVPPDLRKTLNDLWRSSAGAVAFVSGRSLNELDLLFTPLQLPTIAGHGAEFRPVVGNNPVRRQPALDPLLKRRLATVAALGPGILVEDKAYSLALHYRLAPDMEVAVHTAVTEICADFHSRPVEVLHGKLMVEIKQAGFSKATGVRELMTYPPFRGRTPFFIGDDVTDESVFEIMPQLRGHAFCVGRAVAGTAGHFDTPEEVRCWLSSVLAAAVSQHGNQGTRSLEAR